MPFPKYQLRTIHGDGRVDYKTLPGKPDLASIQANDDSEHLLPTGFREQPDGDIQTPLDRIKQAPNPQKAETRTPASDSEALYPAGIQIED
jgi:hypothetical protein